MVGCAVTRQKSLHHCRAPQTSRLSLHFCKGNEEVMRLDQKVLSLDSFLPPGKVPIGCREMPGIYKGHADGWPGRPRV